MKNLIKIEEAGLFLLSLWIFSQTNENWWWFVGLFFAPDFSMLGYLFGNKVGAWSYNIFHHRGLAVILGILGWYFHTPELIFIGILLFSHSSFDRMLGYGLKYEQGFKFTHLGEIGKKEQ